MMKLFQPLADTFKEVHKYISTVQRLTDNEFLFGTRIGNIFGVGNTDTAETEIYKTHPWTYAAINALARNISGVPFIFHTKKGRMKADTDNAFTQLFEKPNRWQGLGQFLEALVSWWHLRGAVMVILQRGNENEVPVEMNVDDPAPWEPAFSKDTKRVIGWWRNMEDGSRVPFAFHEVMYLRFWNPDSEWEGLSPISAASAGITADLLANQFNQTFFKNSGAPGGVVEIEENLTEEQFQRLVRQYDDRHNGPENAHKVLLLEGGATFKNTSVTQKDMDFLNQKKWNRDETLAVFNVPKMEVGVWDDINFAIAKVQAREFWLKNLIPKMKLITWIFWSQLFEKINGGRVWAEFDYSGIEALQDEFNEKVKVARTLWEIGYPMNQVNDRLNLGMPENSWQNTAFLPVNMQTLAVDTDGKPLVVPNTSNPGQDPITPSGTGATDESREGEKVALAPPPGSAPNPGQAATSTGNKEYVTLLTRKMKSFFYHQRTRQLKLLEKTGVGVLASSNEYDKFVKALSNITDTSTLEGLPEYINKKVLEIVCLNVDDKLRMSNEVKELYNGIEKLLPAIAEQQDLLMPAPAKANILTANLEKEMVEATLT